MEKHQYSEEKMWKMQEKGDTAKGKAMPVMIKKWSGKHGYGKIKKVI